MQKENTSKSQLFEFPVASTDCDRHFTGLSASDALIILYSCLSSIVLIYLDSVHLIMRQCQTPLSVINECFW